MFCGYSGNLKQEDLQKIEALEQDLNSRLLAFSCSDVKVAQLGEEELSKMKSLEEKLGVYLVAVNA